MNEFESKLIDVTTELKQRNKEVDAIDNQLKEEVQQGIIITLKELKQYTLKRHTWLVSELSALRKLQAMNEDAIRDFYNEVNGDNIYDAILETENEELFTVLDQDKASKLIMFNKGNIWEYISLTQLEAMLDSIKIEAMLDSIKTNGGKEWQPNKN